MAHYYAIAERGDDRTWWISFPGPTGSSPPPTMRARKLAQAQDALASAAMHGGRLPPSSEDGAKPPAGQINSVQQQFAARPLVTIDQEMLAEALQRAGVKVITVPVPYEIKPPR